MKLLAMEDQTKDLTNELFSFKGIKNKKKFVNILKQIKNLNLKNNFCQTVIY